MIYNIKIFVCIVVTVFIKNCFTQQVYFNTGANSDFIYSVKLRTFEIGEENYVPCTGSIISNDWILTAAHCFSKDKNKKVKIDIIGTTCSSNNCISNKIWRSGKFFSHPDYIKNDYNDIALVKCEGCFNRWGNIELDETDYSKNEYTKKGIIAHWKGDLNVEIPKIRLDVITPSMKFMFKLVTDTKEEYNNVFIINSGKKLKGGDSGVGIRSYKISKLSSILIHETKINETLYEIGLPIYNYINWINNTIGENK